MFMPRNCIFDAGKTSSISNSSAENPDELVSNQLGGDPDRQTEAARHPDVSAQVVGGGATRPWLSTAGCIGTRSTAR